jgi:hypothetical protein
MFRKKLVLAVAVNVFFVAIATGFLAEWLVYLWATRSATHRIFRPDMQERDKEAAYVIIPGHRVSYLS